MFKKEQRFNPQQQFPGPMMGQQAGMQPQGIYPQMQGDRITMEIMENRRRLNNLAKRISRIESYLRIHDTPEYGYYEEDKSKNFSY